MLCCMRAVMRTTAPFITLLRSITAKAKALGKRLLYQCHTRGGMDNDTVAAFLIGAGVDHCNNHLPLLLRFI